MICLWRATAPVAVYSILSPILTWMNKSLFCATPNYVITTSAVQQLIVFIICNGIVCNHRHFRNGALRINRKVFGLRALFIREMFEPRWHKHYLLLSIFLTFQILMSNICLKTVFVSSYQVARSTSILLTAMVTCRNNIYDRRIIPILMITLGIAIGALDKISLGINGIIYGLIASLFGALFLDRCKQLSVSESPGTTHYCETDGTNKVAVAHYSNYHEDKKLDFYKFEEDGNDADMNTSTVPSPTIPSTIPSPTIPSTIPSPTLPTTIPSPTLPTTIPSATLPTTIPSPTLPTTIPCPTLPTIIPNPTLSDPTLSDPTLSDPTLSGPTLSDPTLSDPTLSGPTPSGPTPPVLAKDYLSSYTDKLRQICFMALHTSILLFSFAFITKEQFSITPNPLPSTAHPPDPSFDSSNTISSMFQGCSSIAYTSLVTYALKLLTTSLIAITLPLCTILSLNSLSPTTLSIIGNAKSGIQTIGGWILFAEKITHRRGWSVALSLIGMTLYSINPY